MPLDPYLAARIGWVADLGWEDLADPAARSLFEEFHRDPEPWRVPDLEVADRAVPGPHGDVRIRIYTPPDPSSGTLLWVHGGGFAAGDLDMPESHVVSAELASRARLRVVSVEYRLATGGVRFPVPLDDVVAAWEWAAAEPAGLARPLSLGGASAGGALALSAAIHLRDAGHEPPAALLLAYPVTHFPVPALDDATAVELRALPRFARFPASAIQAMFANYVGRVTDLPTLAAPGHAALAGLPMTSIVRCELDELRPSADLLADQLLEAGVEVRTHLAVGMLHGHLNRRPSLGEVDRSLDFFVGVLGEAAGRRCRSS